MIGLTETFITTIAIAFSVHTADFEPEFVEEERIAIPFVTEKGRFVLFQIGEE